MASFKPTSFFLLNSVLNSSVVNYKSLQIIHRLFALVVVEKEEARGKRGRAAELFDQVSIVLSHSPGSDRKHPAFSEPSQT